MLLLLLLLKFSICSLAFLPGPSATSILFTTISSYNSFILYFNNLCVGSLLSQLISVSLS